MLNRWLFKKIDNSPLIVFRIIFGFLIIAQSWGSILTGYVKERILPAKFTFNFIGLDFIQPLPGQWMYLYFIVMGVLGVGVLIGYKYKWSIGFFTLMWAWVYFMEKTSYNNHYYLLLILCLLMCIVPAHRYFSLDVQKNPAIKNTAMPRWIPLLIIVQMGIVYTFAAVAKCYPDWLNGTVATNLMASKAHYPLLGDLLQNPLFIWTITYFGIFFDLMITPLMLWKPTRTSAFIIAILFHLFNSIVFQIGIFPYLAIGLFIFYFPTKTIHRYFLPQKPYYHKSKEYELPSKKGLSLSLLGIWFAIQLFLPLRHWFIKGDVLWTEEGHRLSWRMMLRSRQGYSTFRVVNKKTGAETFIDKNDYLTPRQRVATATKPDMIWQFAQRLKEKFAKQGQPVAVYVKSRVSINGHKAELLIKPKVDMAQAEWHYFGHNPWIMPRKNQNP